MKLFLLAVVSFLALTNCAALECYGTDPTGTPAKLCTVIGSQTVDTANCGKITCKTNQMCKRQTQWTAGVLTATYLKGCADSTDKDVRCESPPLVGGKKIGMENCYCNTDLCNVASYKAISKMSLVFSLVAFLFALFR